jgi:hypothetical protein
MKFLDILDIPYILVLGWHVPGVANVNGEIPCKAPIRVKHEVGSSIPEQKGKMLS